MKNIKEITLDEVLTEGLRIKRRNGDKVTTQQEEGRIARNLLLYFGKKAKLSFDFQGRDVINRMALVEYYYHFSQRNWCAKPCCEKRLRDEEGFCKPNQISTISKALNLAGACIEYCADEHQIDIANPFKGYSPGGKNARKMSTKNFVERRNEIWRDSEMKQMLLASPPLVKDLILFALNTGMRRSEIVNLTFTSRTNGRDYDRIFQDGNGNWFVLFHVKDQKSNSVTQCALNDAAMEIINRQKHITVRELDDQGVPIDHTYVFSMLDAPRPKNTKIKPKWITTQFRNVRRKLGIREDMFLRNSRKTSGQKLYDAKVPLEAVQGQLRHNKMETTQDWYVTPSMDHAAEAVKSFEVR